MIYRLQRKFILICTASVLAVVSLVFAVILLLSISSMNKNMDILAITTVSDGHFTDAETDENAGYTILMRTNTSGREPYLFGDSTK